MISHDSAMAYLEWVRLGAPLFRRCTRRQYLALVLSADGRVVGTGRNGAPAGALNCTDGGCPRGLTEPGVVTHGSGYGPGAGQCVAVHAEINALLYSDRAARKGGTIVVNGPPCWNCAVAIAGSGLRTLVYSHDPEYADWPAVEEFLTTQKIGLICE